MPQFAYQARRLDGELISGVATALYADEAGEQLAERGLFVIKLGEISGASSGASASASEEVSRLKAKRVRVMWFINQLSVMIETGIGVGQALECLARQAKDPVMAEILAGVSAAVQEGRPLSQSLELYPRTFPRVMTAMVRAAEASGTLGMILSRSAQYMIKEHQIMRRFRGALIYPAFMFVLSVGVTIFLLTTIIPRFSAVFAQKGAALPAPTQALLGASDVLMHYGLYILVAAAAAVVGAVWSLRKPRGRAIADTLQIRTPLVGDVVNRLQQSRTFRAVATLIEAGVPLSDALALVTSISTNINYAAMWDAVHVGVKNGERITQAMERSGLVSDSILQMLECGDQSGRLGMVFSRLSDVLEEEYDQAIKTVSQFIEPVMILFMGSVIGFIAISLLLPMFRVSQIMGK